jgi:hypothetical protein
MNHFARMCLSSKSRQDNRQSRPQYQQKQHNSVPQQQYQQKQYTKQRKKPQYRKRDQVHEIQDIPESETYFIDTVMNITETSANKKSEIFTTLNLDQKQAKLKVDTGARCNVMSLKMMKQLNSNKQYDSSKLVKLVAYGGDTFSTLGVAEFTCWYAGVKHCISFHIVNKPVTALLGLQDTLRLNLVQLSEDVHAIKTDQAPEIVAYPDLFDDKLGTLPVVYHMKLNPAVSPVVHPPRRVPVAMKDRVNAELDRMVDIGVIKPVEEPTAWVSAMVAAKKKNGDEIRICIDPKDLNMALQRPHHPMRTIEEVTANMPNARVFTILDAKQGFWQVPLDEQSSMLTCFNTPQGRYRFLRMPYGINSESEVFQRAMEQVFSGYPCG